MCVGGVGHRWLVLYEGGSLLPHFSTPLFLDDQWCDDLMCVMQVIRSVPHKTFHHCCSANIV